MTLYYFHIIYTVIALGCYFIRSALYCTRRDRGYNLSFLLVLYSILHVLIAVASLRLRQTKCSDDLHVDLVIHYIVDLKTTNHYINPSISFIN